VARGIDGKRIKVEGKGETKDNSRESLAAVAVTIEK
jgi:hypothetical protein